MAADGNKWQAIATKGDQWQHMADYGNHQSVVTTLMARMNYEGSLTQLTDSQGGANLKFIRITKVDAS